MKNTIAMIDAVVKTEPTQITQSNRYSLHTDIQRTIDAVQCASECVPTDEHIKHWADAAYTAVQASCALPTENEITVRLVSNEEIAQLNRDYRDQDKPTNVLSFPAEIPEHMQGELPPYLGDIAIAHEVVLAEAEAQHKSPQQHYAHMVTHGVLHLCGYDHQCDDSAERMESLEVDILSLSGFSNPYAFSAQV